MTFTTRSVTSTSLNTTKTVKTTKTTKRTTMTMTKTFNSRTSTWTVSPRGRSPTSRRGAVAVRAAAPPSGVSQPPRSPVTPPPKFGFVENAEVLNSRAAMIGFFALLAVEAIAGKGLLELVGVTVGKGLDIGL